MGLWGNVIKIPEQNLIPCPNKGKYDKCLGHMMKGDFFCRRCYLEQKSYKTIKNKFNKNRLLDELEIQRNERQN